MSWPYAEAAKQFHAAHGHARFAPAFHSFLEAGMENPALSSDARCILGLIRYAWGQQSDVAVDLPPPLSLHEPKQRPLSQAAFAERIGLSAGAASDACVKLRAQSLLNPNSSVLRLDDQQAGPLFAAQRAQNQRAAMQSRSDSTDNPEAENPQSGSDSTNSSSPFLRFQEAFLGAHPDLAREISDAETSRDHLYAEARQASEEVRRLRRAVLSAWQRHQRRSDSAAENPAKAMEYDSDSSNFRPGSGSDSTLQSVHDSTRSHVQTAESDVQYVRTDSKNNPSVFNAGAPAPVRTLLQKTEQSTSSSAEPMSKGPAETTTTTTAIPPEIQIAAELQVDPGAASKLWAAATAVDATITPTEIVGICALKLQQWHPAITAGKVQNWVGLLIRSLPDAVFGPLRDQARAEIAKREAAAAAAARRQAEMEAEQRKILNDPAASEEDRRWARLGLGLEEES